MQGANTSPGTASSQQVIHSPCCCLFHSARGEEGRKEGKKEGRMQCAGREGRKEEGGKFHCRRHPCKDSPLTLPRFLKILWKKQSLTFGSVLVTCVSSRHSRKFEFDRLRRKQKLNWLSRVENPLSSSWKHIYIYITTNSCERSTVNWQQSIIDYQPPNLNHHLSSIIYIFLHCLFYTLMNTSKGLTGQDKN